MTYRQQFIIISFAWLVIFLVLAVFIRPWVITSQDAFAGQAVAARRKLAEQIAQQENLRRAEASLTELRQKPLGVGKILPGEADIVSELLELETWAVDLGLEFKVQLSGEVKEAKKADTKTDVALVPMTVQLRGSTAGALSFLRLLEFSSLPFITDEATLSVDATSKTGGIVLTLSGNAYIKR